MNVTDCPVAVRLGGVDFEADGVGGGWGDWDGLDLVTVGGVVVYQVEGLQFPGDVGLYGDPFVVLAGEDVDGFGVVVGIAVVIAFDIFNGLRGGQGELNPHAGGLRGVGAPLMGEDGVG